ncbi:hypothetical protein PS1_020610 [Malus domestica]
MREIEEQDACRSILRDVEANKETTKNVFQRFGKDSELKGLPEVFRNFEAFKEVKGEEARLPCWVDVKVPQLTNYSSMRQGRLERTMSSIPPVTKMNLARLGRKWCWKCALKPII